MKWKLTFLLNCSVFRLIISCTRNLFNPMQKKKEAYNSRLLTFVVNTNLMIKFLIRLIKKINDKIVNKINKKLTIKLLIK
jgi:hypothetical protein